MRGKGATVDRRSDSADAVWSRKLGKDRWSSSRGRAEPGRDTRAPKELTRAVRGLTVWWVFVVCGWTGEEWGGEQKFRNRLPTNICLYKPIENV